MKQVILPICILLALLAMTGCSKQNWYHGAQSAQQAECMQQPQAEYDDCMAPSQESFDEYEKKRALLKENGTQEKP